MVESFDEFVAEGGFVVDMAAYHFDEGVALELAAHLLEVVVALADRTVDTEPDARNHRELFAGVVVEQSVELDDRLVPLPHDGNNVLRGELVDALSVPAVHLRAYPGPLHVVVAAVHGAEEALGLVEGVAVVAGDAVELLPEECVVGVFHEEACHCLLPQTGENERVQLSIRYNWAQGRMSLSILDKRTGSEEEVKDVISFYIDEYGYAYVTKEGKVVIPESERFNMYPLKSAYRFHSDDSIIAVYMDGPIFEFIVSSD